MGIGEASACRPDRHCLGSLSPFSHIHGHALAFRQGGHARPLQGGNMNKDILAAAFDADKTEALIDIEPLHGSGHLYGLPLWGRPASLRGARRKTSSGTLAASLRRRRGLID